MPDPHNDHDVVSDDTGAKLQREASADLRAVQKRSLVGVVSFFSRTLLLNGISIVAQLFLAARLSLEDFGVYGLVVTITNFFTIISDVGLAASLIQKKEPPTLLELRTTFTVQQILSWVVFGLIVLTSLGMQLYGKIDDAGLYLALAFALSFPIVSVKTISSILLERDLDFGKLVVPAIVESIVFNTLAVVLALQGYGLYSFTVAIIAKAVVGVVVMFMIKPWRIGLAFSPTSFAVLMRVGGAFQLNDMLAKAKDDLFYITVALLIPAREFGYITWAKQWSRFPYSLTVDNVSAVTFPAFARLQHDKRALSSAIEKTLYFVTLLAFPLLVGISVIAYPVTILVPSYAKWQPALFSLALFSLSLAFSAFSTPLINTLNAIGKISESLRMMIFWTVTQWVLFPLFFSWFGYHAVAIISLVLALSSLVVVILVQAHIPFRFGENVWRQAVGSMVMGVVIFSTQHIWSQSFFHLGLGVCLGAGIFFALMLMLGYSQLKSACLLILQKKRE